MGDHTGDWRVLLANLAADHPGLAAAALRERTVPELGLVLEPLVYYAACGRLSHVGDRLLRLAGVELERREMAEDPAPYGLWWLGAMAA